MSDQVTKRQFIQMLHDERLQWEALLIEIGAARMEEPGAAGFWSVKDVIAYVTAYEHWLVDWLRAAAQCELPAHSVINNPGVDSRNEKIFAANHDRPLSEVLVEAQDVSERLLDTVEGLTDRDLNDAGWTAWFVEPFWNSKRKLWECIAGDSYEHYHEHIPAIHAWLGEPNSKARKTVEA
jgi:hypothetical protein